MKRLPGLALLAALATTAVACTDATGPDKFIAGTYTLRTVGGAQVPAQLWPGYQVISSQIVLDDAGNYSGSTTDVLNGVQSQHRIDGYWTLNGSRVSLYDQAQSKSPYVGTLDYNRIVIDANTSASGYDEVYTK